MFHLEKLLAKWCLAGCISGSPLMSAFVLADPDATGQFLRARLALEQNRQQLTNPAPAGAVVVRGPYRSTSLRLIQEIAKKFPSKDDVHVAFDDHASFGRFCDRDSPFHILINEGDLTEQDDERSCSRFPIGAPQPRSFHVGQLRVIFVVHKSNSLRALDFAQIAKVLSDGDKKLNWRKLNGEGTLVRCYTPLEKTWARSVIQAKCLTIQEEMKTSSVRRMKRLAYRNDLITCGDAKEVIAYVRKDRNGLGFFAWEEGLTKQALQGVKVIPIAAKEGEKAITPAFVPTIDEAYPLAESVYLWLHPDAPPRAREFCEFLVSRENANAMAQKGMWTKYDAEETFGTQRMAEVKKGNGVPVSVVGSVNGEGLTRDLGLRFVKAHQAVQLGYQKKPSPAEGVQRFLSGDLELLLLQGEPGDEFISPLKKHEKLVLGKAALGVIVHPNLKLTSLLWKELQQICAGEIKKWPAANGEGPVIHGYGLPMDQPVMGIYRGAVSGKKTAPRAVRGSPDPAQRPDRRFPDTAQEVDRTSSESQETFGPTRGGVGRPAPSAGTRPAPSAPLKLTKCTDTAEVILSVARDPAAIGFVDLSQMPKDDGSFKLVGLAMDDKQVLTPSIGNLPENYPLAQAYTLYLSPKAGEAAKDFFAWLSENLPEERYAGEQSPDAPLSKAGTLAKASPLKELLAKHGLLPATKEVAEDSHADLLAGERNTTPIEGLDLSLEEPETVKQPSDGMRSMPASIRQPHYPVQTASLRTPSAPEKSSTSAQPVAKPKTVAPPAAQSGMSEHTIALVVAGLSGTVLIGGAAVWLSQAQRRRKPARRSNAEDARPARKTIASAPQRKRRK